MLFWAVFVDFTGGCWFYAFRNQKTWKSTKMTRFSMKKDAKTLIKRLELFLRC